MRYTALTVQRTICLLAVIVMHALLPFTDNNAFWLLHAGRASEWANQANIYLNFLLIPSFVFGSGFLFGQTLETARRSALEQVGNRARRLLLPWLLTSLFWLAPLYTFFDLPAYNRPEGMSLAATYAAAVTGTFTDHLWFLPVLFWVSVFWLAAAGIVRREGTVAGAIVAVLAAVLMDRYGGGLTWFCIWETAGPLVYFYAGLAAWRHRERLDALLLRFPSASLAGAIMLLVLGAPFAGYSLVSWLLGCVGAVLTYGLSLGLARSAYHTLTAFAVYRYFEKYSFRYYLLHLPGGLLSFKLLEAWTGTTLPPSFFVFCSFSLNFAATSLCVAALNALERRLRR